MLRIKSTFYFIQIPLINLELICFIEYVICSSAFVIKSKSKIIDDYKEEGVKDCLGQYSGANMKKLNGSAEMKRGKAKRSWKSY